MTVNYTPLLGLAQPVTGTESGTWGDTINASLTALVESSIAGVATASVSSGNWTLSTTGSGAANEQRMAILIPTGSPGVSRNIIAPSQSKIYIVVNQSNASVVLKGAATTGVTIASGKTTMVAWNGSDFVELTPNTIAGILPVVNGGTGTSTPALVAGTNISITGTWPNQTITASGGGSGSVTSVAMTVPSFLSVSGSPITSSGTLAVTLSGTALPVANGGTGVTTSTGSGSVVLSTSPTLTTPALGTPSSGTLTNCTGLPTTGITGTLGVGNGGTGATSLTANNVLLGNGTSAVQVVAPSTSGNVLTSNGTTWVSSAPAGGSGWEYLTTVTASAATTADVENAFNTTYDMYVIVAEGVTTDSASSTILAMRYKYNGTYATAGYAFVGTAINSNVYGGQNSTSAGQIYMTTNVVTTSSRGSYVIYIPFPSVTGVNRQVWWTGTQVASSNPYIMHGSSTYFSDNASAVSGIRFFTMSGNITGTFRLYGIKNS